MASSQDGLQLDEISILGNILLDPTGDSFLVASQRVTPEDFTDTRNQAIFRACLSLNRKGINPDFATVEEELKNAKEFDEIGGEEYLNAVVEKAVTQGSIENYLASVKDKAVFNRYINELNDIIKEAKSTPISDISEFIGSRTDKILEISQQRRITAAKSLSDVSDALVARLVKQTKDFKEKNVLSANGVTGVPTGYAEADKFTKGWHKGDMIVIGARPSVGKTAFALNLVYQVARKHNRLSSSPWKCRRNLLLSVFLTSLRVLPANGSTSSIIRSSRRRITSSSIPMAIAMPLAMPIKLQAWFKRTYLPSFLYRR